jgi:hypothetical protein
MPFLFQNTRKMARFFGKTGLFDLTHLFSLAQPQKKVNCEATDGH